LGEKFGVFSGDAVEMVQIQKSEGVVLGRSGGREGLGSLENSWTLLLQSLEVKLNNIIKVFDFFFGLGYVGDQVSLFLGQFGARSLLQFLNFADFSGVGFLSLQNEVHKKVLVV